MKRQMNRITLILIAISSVIIIVGGSIAIFALTQNDVSIPDPISAERIRESVIYQELEKAKEYGLRVGTVVDNIMKSHKKELNRNNCSGILADFDKNGQFDKTVMETVVPTPKENKDIIVKYNYCSFLWSSNPSITFIVTTKKLLKKKFEDIVNGKEYIPVVIAKKRESDSDFHLVEAKIPKDSFLQ